MVKFLCKLEENGKYTQGVSCFAGAIPAYTRSKQKDQPPITTSLRGA